MGKCGTKCIFIGRMALSSVVSGHFVPSMFRVCSGAVNPHLFEVQFNALFVRFEHREWRKTPTKPKTFHPFNWPFRPACPSRKTRWPVSQPDRGALTSRDNLSPAAWRPFPSSRSKNTVFRLVPPGSASEWSTGNPRTHFSGFSVFSRVFLRTLYF